ncbi:hypothetical protein ACJ5H2_15850 [Nocardioides sp. R1-1]|uniref:hypothetical protein n=1 Tax=Nocardioides sp. R1-1 TaxID=3383502 RepID=UPI0038D00DEC
MSPLPRALVRAATVLACTAGLVAAPSLASAAELVHTDPAGDVRTGGTESETGRPAPGERRTDIRNVRISHSVDAVTVRIRTRGALPRKKVFVTVTLRTPAGAYEASYMKLFGTTYQGVAQDMEDIDCPGFVADLGGKVTTLTIPTSCIGSPEWIRAGVGVGQLRGERWTADDGLRRGLRGQDLRLSQRIARG